MTKETLEDLIENFALFEDWEERYRYLIDLGRSLPEMDEALKTEATLVRGCTSRVWIKEDIKDGVQYFTADSDAHIVRGLIAVLLAAFQKKTAEEIQNSNIEKSFQDIGLADHLSPNRRNGFFAMVEKIKTIAGE